MTEYIMYQGAVEVKEKELVMLKELEAKANPTPEPVSSGSKPTYDI